MTRVLIMGGGVAGPVAAMALQRAGIHPASTRPNPTTDADPAETLMLVARGHAVYCRRDIAGVLLTLRIEFTGQDHPVGRAITEVVDRLLASCTELITAGRASGAIPRPAASGHRQCPPRRAQTVAIEVAGRAPHDIELAERAVRGLLGLPPPVVSTPMEVHE